MTWGTHLPATAFAFDAKITPEVLDKVSRPITHLSSRHHWNLSK